jgi:ribosomal-protein-alanine N-acetyltransferase
VSAVTPSPTIRDVLLRPWTRSDAEWYAAQSQDAEILRWTTEKVGLTAAEVRDAIDGFHPATMAWVIADPATGERLGNAAVEVSDGVAEPSYWVAAGARRRGVATVALRTMVARCRSAGLHRIELVAHMDNHASRRVAEKIGFVAVGTQRRRGLGRCVRYALRDRPTDSLTDIPTIRALVTSARLTTGYRPR